jgi:hypothetical protein
MKVLIAFYCTKEKKAYKLGDEYTGNRKELFGLYVKGQEKKEAKPKANKKEKK